MVVSDEGIRDVERSPGSSEPCPLLAGSLEVGGPCRDGVFDRNISVSTYRKLSLCLQVYRATLLDGQQVAVKVQRPDVLQSVTLDLYVIRLLLLFLSKWDSARDSALSILGVIDNWADRFIQELDYIQEAANGDR